MLEAQGEKQKEQNKMKKLMIAAAAAAMIGASEAATATYDFVANLRTTAGQAGVDQWTAGAANLGVAPNGNMWYDNVPAADVVKDATTGLITGWSAAAAALYPNLGWATHTSIGGATIPVLYVIPNAAGIAELTAAEAAYVAGLAAGNVQSYGYWCCQLAWYVKTTANCFRVVGADAIVTEVTLDRATCCTAGTDAFYSAAVPANKVLDFATANKVFNRFGAQTADNAAYLELYADVANVNTFYAGLPFVGQLAGQGYQQVLTSTGAAPAPVVTQNVPVNISGMIVGSTTAPVCPDCCVRPLPSAIAFKCLDVAAGTAERTAAFGTFYLQIKSFQ